MNNIPIQRVAQRLPSWLKTYPAATAAILCGILTLMGWIALGANHIGIAIWILLIAYGIGGYTSAREGLDRFL
ncbi:hypothetical protein [Acaryochloris sp. CCMEE 5410]|uniref:hypothetical protein n=1 Tax=Acaryochloris sp. CCMEE 5410 TaxID=310037 RepID=UPI0002484A54|nr:hypothetical protein [Acaryochloris sp. CCMEE 5410]KAI9129186.1 hypothetical protein ON05_035840 [Acaryochloris sp. CCMEE 5410]